MSDEVTENENPEVETPDEPQGSEESTDWKAEARKWEKRAKDANALREDADKWREYEQSLKPEQERMRERLALAEQEAETARVQLLKYEVANEKQLPADALALLTGSNREELEEKAETLLALIANQSKPKTPAPDPSQGRVVDGTSRTADQFAAAIGDIL